MQLFALVDYDNAKTIRREIAVTDVHQNLEEIAARVAGIRRDLFPGCNDVAIRLYGGWIDRNGNHTALANGVLSGINRIRGRREGARIHPEIAYNLLDSKLRPLVGTVRAGEQKMVDTLLVCDASYIAHTYACPMLVLSNDSDVLPGVLNAARYGCRVALSRKDEVGNAFNDELLAKAGVTLC